jgi:putative addiction module component (TIGR02574 family)
MATVDEVLQAALTLDEAEREVVAELIWASVPADAPLRLEENERAAIAEELRRNWADFEAGSETADSWENVKKRLNDGLDLDV